jgi:ABC-2 type transport system permease protein
VALPLMLLGGVLLPMQMAPDWLYIASRFNPLAYLVEAERALFAGQMFSMTVGWGVLVSIGVGALGLAVGSATIKRATL